MPECWGVHNLARVMSTDGTGDSAQEVLEVRADGHGGGVNGADAGGGEANKKLTRRLIKME